MVLYAQHACGLHLTRIRLKSSWVPHKLTRSFRLPRRWPSVPRKLSFLFVHGVYSNKRNSQPKAQPKSQPKSAAADKKGAAAKATGKTGKKGRGRSARPAQKTAAELDSEMADYFESAPNNENANANANTNANASAGEAMEEIMVREQPAMTTLNEYLTSF